MKALGQPHPVLQPCLPQSPQVHLQATCHSSDSVKQFSEASVGIHTPEPCTPYDAYLQGGMWVSCLS